MKYLESIERKIEPPTERKKVLEDIFSSSTSLSYNLSTSLQNHCDKTFNIWIQELNNNGLCKCKDGLFLHKIHYGAAPEYKNTDIFKQPGIYLWGCDDISHMGIPRYIGKTEKSFKKRLFSRYIPRKDGKEYKSPTQCGISEILRDYYEPSQLDVFRTTFKKNKKIVKEEIENEMTKKDLKIKIRSYERLYGALDFSKFEKENIWFAMLPFEDADKKFIDIFETLFIHSAQNYNKENDYPELLNKGKIDID